MKATTAGDPVRSFPPVAARDARVLILGSMPGVASLVARRYYAHPRNAFWPIMTALLEVAPDASYAQRTAALKRGGIALWDVLDVCRRSGSLDSAIERDSHRVNDFAAFFAAHPHIEQVFFNGTTAETYFRRQVLPQLAGSTLTLRRLPSTSPAHAEMNAQHKLAAWRAALAPWLT
ncbi:MAG: DNA-deoxyinosine glycosylase [Steroidobacteraceae bacterium]